MSPNTPPSKSPVTLFVCNNCGQTALDQSQSEAVAPGMGARLGAALAAALGADPTIRVQPVTCMGGCNHPCAIALSSAHKLTYLYGDMTDAPDTVAAIARYAHQYQDSATGMVPRNEKDPVFANVLVRLPPPEWVSADGKVTREGFDLLPGAGVLRRADEDG